jgi:triosephosphate isomerase (TIM)
MSKPRRKLIAANWKMNLTIGQGNSLVEEILSRGSHDHCDLAFAPPFTHLTEIKKVIGKQNGVFLSAQNCHQEEKGAFTGEVSPVMLKDIGVDMAIIGHSERRSIYGESNELINQKIKAAISHGLKVIFCFGEKLEERDAGNHFDTVKSQLTEGLIGLDENAIKEVTFAYEPVWAIGTGRTATPQQAREMHQMVREQIASTYSNDLAQSARILYGGSVKPNNASDLLNSSEIDGALVGGASLKANDFLAIVNACK